MTLDHIFKGKIDFYCVLLLIYTTISTNNQYYDLINIILPPFFICINYFAGYYR